MRLIDYALCRRWNDASHQFIVGMPDKDNLLLPSLSHSLPHSVPPSLPLFLSLSPPPPLHYSAHLPVPSPAPHAPAAAFPLLLTTLADLAQVDLPLDWLEQKRQGKTVGFKFFPLKEADDLKPFLDRDDEEDNIPPIPSTIQSNDKSGKDDGKMKADDAPTGSLEPPTKKQRTSAE